MKKYLLLFFTFFVFIFSSKAEFGIYASAVYINVNGTSQFYCTQILAGNTSAIGLVNFDGNNLGSFVANTATLTLRGGEVKTFRDNNGNVCSGKLFFTVYPQGARPVSPVFTAVNLDFFCDCNGDATFNSCGGGPCTIGRDQKWQTVNQANDLTQLTEGNYTLEIYYQVNGDPTSNVCTVDRFDSNFGANYKANFTITSNLAVNFSGIKGSISNNVVKLKWSIENDRDILRYEIERSANGINFAPIGVVASVKSNLLYNYSFEDNHAQTGDNFYRIKLYGTDNSISYSNVFRVAKGNVSGDDLQIVYNQAAGVLAVNPGAISKGKYQINIVNYIGQQVMSTTVVYNEIGNNITLNLPKKLSAGAYKLLLTNNELKYKGSFLIR